MRPDHMTKSQLELLLHLAASGRMDLDLAVGIATVVHEGQTYGKGKPYLDHVLEVLDILTFYEGPDLPLEIRCAAVLHDVLEDSLLTEASLDILIGYRVTRLVRLVSDEPGENRAERKRKTLPKTTEDRGATLIKLADRIANVRNCIRTNNHNLFQMYKKEHQEFRKILGRHESKMWPVLEELLEAPLSFAPRVIIESPFAGDIEANIAYARACVRDSLKKGEVPLASHLLYTQDGVLRDEAPKERKLGMEAGWSMMRDADFVAVYTDRGISGGMEQGVERARALGIPCYFRSLECTKDLKKR